MQQGIIFSLYYLMLAYKIDREGERNIKSTYRANSFVAILHLSRCHHQELMNIDR